MVIIREREVNVEEEEQSIDEMSEISELQD